MGLFVWTGKLQTSSGIKAINTDPGSSIEGSDDVIVACCGI